MADSFYAEGNNGGDNIQIQSLPDGRIGLKVGHQCVYFVDAVVPVEFLTAAITYAVDKLGIDGVLRNVGWKEEYTESLLEKVCAEQEVNW